MVQPINIADMKNLYPDEWVLLGNPMMDESKIDVLSGIPLKWQVIRSATFYICLLY